MCGAAGVAVTVTRGCVGVWDLRVGKLLTRLADSPLGAIVTHAVITQDGRYIVSAESGNILVWNRLTEQVLFKEEQQGVRQLDLLEDGARFLAVSRPSPANAAPNAEPSKATATATARALPSECCSEISSFVTELRRGSLPSVPHMPVHSSVVEWPARGVMTVPFLSS